jgi:hypothetical protein
MTPAGNGLIWYKRGTGEVAITEPNASETYEAVAAVYYTYRMTLHGKPITDDERTDDNTERVMAWSYQVDYDNDPINQIKDGGGIDRFGSFTEEFATANPSGSDVYVDSQGVWFVRVTVAVPQLLALAGPAGYFGFLLNNVYGGDEDAARRAWELTTKQLGGGRITAMATDQSTCNARFTNGKYYYYRGVRVPSNHPGRRCSAGGAAEFIQGELLLENFRAFSDTLVKEYHFTLQTPTGDYDGGPPPF